MVILVTYYGRFGGLRFALCHSFFAAFIPARSAAALQTQAPSLVVPYQRDPLAWKTPVSVFAHTTPDLHALAAASSVG